MSFIRIAFNGAALSHFSPFVTKNFRIVSSFLLKLFGEKRYVNSVIVFSGSIKPINPIQKYPHIIESYACILKIFVLISFGICSTPKESK